MSMRIDEGDCQVFNLDGDLTIDGNNARGDDGGRAVQYLPDINSVRQQRLVRNDRPNETYVTQATGPALSLHSDVRAEKPRELE